MLPKMYNKCVSGNTERSAWRSQPELAVALVGEALESRLVQLQRDASLGVVPHRRPHEQAHDLVRLAAGRGWPDRRQGLEHLPRDRRGARNRPWLIKRLSYRTQELMTGLSLSAEAEQRIADLGEDEPVRLREEGDPPPLPEPAAKPRDPRLPPVGTIIRRAHKGEVHEITVLDDGFEYEGRHYTSLSTIAREVTGTSRNGFLWAGLCLRKARRREA